MKKVFLFALVMLIIFSGCNTGSSNPESSAPELSLSPVPNVSNSPDINTVNSLEIFQMAGNPNQKYYNLMDWQKYIHEKFGIEIYIYYTGRTSARVLYLNYTSQVPYSRFNNSDVLTYDNPALAYDLTPYYEQFGWDSFIDKQYIDALTINGQIFAVPAVSPKYIIPRYYRKEYLDALKMDVPTTVDELYNYLKGVKSINKEDPTFYPICIQDRHALPSLSDIFRAYGVYVNSQVNTALSYNPNTDSFENAVYSDDFETALGFVRTLQQNNFLGIIGEAFIVHDEDGTHKNPFIADKGNVNKQFASEYFSVYNTELNDFIRNINMPPVYEYEKGYYLTQTNIANVCEVRRDMAFYVFPASVENIQGTVNLFNQVFTDSAYYADLRYGIRDEEYTLNGSNIIPNEPVMGYFTDLKQIKPVDDPNIVINAVSPGNVPGLSRDMFFEKNVFNQYFTYSSSIGNSSYSSNMYQILLIPDVSPADAISEYKKTAQKEGIPDLISQINEKLGTVPAYDYTP